MNGTVRNACLAEGGSRGPRKIHGSAAPNIHAKAILEARPKLAVCMETASSDAGSDHSGLVLCAPHRRHGCLEYAVEQPPPSGVHSRHATRILTPD